MCKPPDTTGATANRFENDLVRQPQADCCTVSISLIIPHVDRGSLSVSVIDRASRSQMWVRYVLSGPPRYCYSRPRWLRKSMASRCTLSEFILSASQPDLRRALKSRSAPSRDSRWPHKGKQWPDGIAERDTYFIHRMWSDGGGVCVRLEMQSFAFVVVVVVVSRHFPPGTPFG